MRVLIRGMSMICKNCKGKDCSGSLSCTPGKSVKTTLPKRSSLPGMQVDSGLLTAYRRRKQLFGFNITAEWDKHAHALCVRLRLRVCSDSATSAERISLAVHLRVAIEGSTNRDFILCIPETSP